MTDEEIVKSIQDGNKENYELIVERYEKKLFFYIKKMINQPAEEVEDVLQEVFINSYINIQSFDTKKKFSSWIYRIAHNKSVDYIKKVKLKIKICEDDDLFEENNKLIEDVLVEEENKTQVFRSINLLEEKYKEVVLLYYYENKSYEEISEILRIPTNNVGVMLFRAKEKLKVFLKNYEKN